MAKAVRVNLYNKGRRTWPLIDDGKDIELMPGKSIEIDKTLADKMIKNYPNDFILGNKPVIEDSAKVKAFKKEIETLTKTLGERDAEIEGLTKQIVELTNSTITPSKEAK